MPQALLCPECECKDLFRVSDQWECARCGKQFYPPEPEEETDTGKEEKSAANE